MSNEFSNMKFLQRYIVRNIIEFFSKNSETITSRYVLYFDSLENIVSFEKELKSILGDASLREEIKAKIGDASLDVSLVEPYQFFNDDAALEYEAIQIRVKTSKVGHHVIFVPDCDENYVELGDAFKNGIRNKFVDNQEEGILFYLSTQNIASVSKTTENFQKQGMPLSLNNVYDNLKRQIPIIKGKNQQTVVLYALDKIKSNKPQGDNSLIEFGPIIRIIETQSLGSEDFHDFHMFHMELTDLGKNNGILAENYRIFRTVSQALEDQELDSVMSSYETNIIKEIQKAYDEDEKDWDKKLTYERIQKFKKANQKKFKIEGSITILDEDDIEIDHEYYLDFIKRTSASFIIFTKNYPKSKKFSINVRFTQKATAESKDFLIMQMNSRGTSHRITVEGDCFNKNGTVVFTGLKDSKYTVLVSVLNTEQNFFADACIGFTKKGSKYIYQLKATDYVVCLGDGDNVAHLFVEFTPSLSPLPVNIENRTKIEFKFSDGESAKEHAFKLNLNDNSAIIDTSIKFSESALRKIEFFEIFNQCMINGDSFYVEDGKLYNRHKHSEKYSIDEFDVAGKKYRINDLLELEKALIKSRYKHVKTAGLQDMQDITCKVPADVNDVYNQICDHLTKMSASPSVCTIDNELFRLYQNYIDLILNYVKDTSLDFRDKQPLSNEIFDLFKLGMVEDADGLIWLSPLSPLSVAYQMQLRDGKNQWMELDSYLYKSLGFGNMLPFISDEEDTVYQAIKGNYPIQWSCYCDASQSIIGDANTYYQKIEDYYSKFGYLFEGVANNTFIINIIGIQHTSEIIKALLKLFKSKKINPKTFCMEVNYYYKGTGKNDFDSMTEYEYVLATANKFYGVGVKDKDYIETFSDWYVENVKYYSCYDDGNYKYAHISFCALQNEKKSALNNTISDSKSGIMLEGLISDVPSSLDKESGIYKYGFGAQYSDKIKGKSSLIQLACAYNELAKCKEGSPASRDVSIAQGVQNTKSRKLEAIYKASNWVVFIEPKIDLDFFIEQEETSDADLMIIHYPDKNITSSGYTSITVTQKSDQYINVIREYLKAKMPMFSGNIDVKGIIKNYNAYSGEWLMTFINNKQIEEKISLMSAISFCRNYFDLIYENYTWVPIALDEVLRVTGAIGGTLTNVLFSKKVLVNRGIIKSLDATSDDLLMAGIKQEEENVSVIYIPIEVKHGNCDFKTKNDAHNQVCNTAYLLRKSFLDSDDENTGKLIDRKIYRNYLMQHVISNIEKMLAYKIVDDAKYRAIVESEARMRLLNDLYNLDINLNTDAYAFYFVEGQTDIFRTQNTQDKVIELSAPITEMYRFLVDSNYVKSEAESLSNIRLDSDATQYEISVLEEDNLAEEEDIEFGDRESEKLEMELSGIGVMDTLTDCKPNEAIECDLDSQANIVTEGKRGLSNVRVLIGQDIAKHNIFWEFGNRQLANRHLLITGTSGQGKTYSIQTMLFELTKAGISSVIFDYTEGFMKNQLEEAFVKKLGPNINEQIVYSTGVPINPFVRHEIDIAGTIVTEKAADVASRLADIFGHVYDFGEQQSSAIFSAALHGINTYGDNMSMKHFQNELEKIQETNKAAKTVISKMEPFFQTISFECISEFDWGNVLYDSTPTINIFQLTLINREMQVIITELMLWDAWYYTKKFGNKDKPFVVVLDEAQNLSHKANSPSAAILTEGRKFGWSAWFATQSLKVLKDEEVVRLSQSAFKLYFKPTDDEVVKIAKLLDPTGEINWISEVRNLQKGQCIVVGNRTNNSGIFGNTQPTVVSVASFEKRAE